MGMVANLEYDRDALAAFCRHHHIKTLRFFGSVLRDDFGDDSDVDVLVEFEEDHTPGFFRLVEMEEELSQMLDRRADLKTPFDLSPRFRQDVLQQAETAYAA